MAAEGMQSHDQSCGNCPTASHPATKKGRINKPILPKPARCAKSDRLLAPDVIVFPYGALLYVRGLNGLLTQNHAVWRPSGGDNVGELRIGGAAVEDVTDSGTFSQLPPPIGVIVHSLVRLA